MLIVFFMDLALKGANLSLLERRLMCAATETDSSIHFGQVRSKEAFEPSLYSDFSFGLFALNRFCIG